MHLRFQTGFVPTIPCGRSGSHVWRCFAQRVSVSCRESGVNIPTARPSMDSSRSSFCLRCYTGKELSVCGHGNEIASPVFDCALRFGWWGKYPKEIAPGGINGDISKTESGILTGRFTCVCYDTGWIRRSDKPDFDTGAGPKCPANSRTIAATGSAHRSLPG